jgi:hypothetical protein
MVASSGNNLGVFLRDSANSVSREVILSHLVIFQLKIGSAMSGFDLRVYRPDVDRDGFDLLLEQRSITRVLQLKTVSEGAITKVWQVRRHLLHPSRLRAERLGFRLPELGLGDGLNGGVLLVDFEVGAGDLQVRYRFFDVAVAAAHACRLTNLPPAQTEKSRAWIGDLRKSK